MKELLIFFSISMAHDFVICGSDSFVASYSIAALNSSSASYTTEYRDPYRIDSIPENTDNSERCTLPSDMNFGVEPRIVGGGSATLGQFPNFVSFRIHIYGFYFHFCGGFMITKKLIGTAAHCFLDKSFEDKYAFVGTVTWDQGTLYGLTSPINTINGPAMMNDIAIVGTIRDIEFDFFAHPLPLSGAYVGDAERVIAIGLGKTGNDNPPSDNLMWAEFTTITNKRCKEIFMEPYRNGIVDHFICVYNRPEKGSCDGDSGSPLILNGKVVGVNSWGHPNCDICPDVFERISTVKPWIDSIVTQSDASNPIG